MSRIEEIRCREILDSKGRPTVETDVITNDGFKGTASAPCGTSVGHAEAQFLRDGGPRLRGLGVQFAVRHVTEHIAPILIGIDVTHQQEIDDRMIALDGSALKRRLGANAIYSVSVAVARAAANSLGIPLYRWLSDRESYTLPIPAFNVVNGGAYGNMRTETQEFLWIPTCARTYREALDMGVSLFYELPDTIRRSFGADSVRYGHSAGYAAPVNDPDTVIATILDASSRSGHGEGGVIGLDLAAGQFYDGEKDVYRYLGRDMLADDIIEYLVGLAHKYPLVFVEDPLHEDDFQGFSKMVLRLGTLPVIVGDDLFAMDIQRLKMGERLCSARGLVYKPNMIGTVTEAMRVADWATDHGYLVVPSIRSGSSPDDPIADFCVAIGAQLMKSGAPRSGERVACHNRLLQIEEELGRSGRIPSFSQVKRFINPKGHPRAA